MVGCLMAGERTTRLDTDDGNREIRTSGYPHGKGPGETVRDGTQGQDRDDGRWADPWRPGGLHHGHPDREDLVDPREPRGHRRDAALQDGPARPADPRVPDDAGRARRDRDGDRGD